MFRVGLGQDSHKLSKSSAGKPLVLGGVEISREIKIEGANSDGDVLLHAICNAICTALSLGSFSQTANRMLKEGVEDSKEYVKAFYKIAKKRGYRVNNVSAMIEAGQPRLEEKVKIMEKSIAGLFRLKEDRVGIAITSGEGLTAFGKGQGIQVIAIISLKKHEEH